ncbi:hypothetical protein HY798_04635 [Candidatus Falkowbacteria bacterium]|nr:hypothetical protein [Candidatus Falkowbacteria bacterium]
MKYKTKIIIIISVIVIGLIGLGFWIFGGGQKVTWTTSAGEQRSIVMPKIPGMKFISEERGECFWRATYAYEWYKDQDLSMHIKDLLQSVFSQQNWVLESDIMEGGFHVLRFSTEKSGSYETMVMKIIFEPGRGTLFSLNYQWPPCAGK